MFGNRQSKEDTKRVNEFERAEFGIQDPYAIDIVTREWYFQNQAELLGTHYFIAKLSNDTEIKDTTFAHFFKSPEFKVLENWMLLKKQQLETGQLSFESLQREIQQNDAFQYLIRYYPMQYEHSTHKFLLLATIWQLMNFHTLTDEQIRLACNQLTNTSLLHDQISEIQSQYARHARNNSNHYIEIDWSQYFPDCNDEKIKQLIAIFPAQMQFFYVKIIAMINAKQEHEEFKKDYINETYHDKHAYKKLLGLRNEIIKMSRKLPTDDERVTRFTNLYHKLEDEIFNEEAPKCHFNDTIYPAVLDHFTQLAKKINADHSFTQSELTQSFTSFDKKVLNKPMTPQMKAAICGLIGAIVGSALGLVVGAAVTFWGGGFGGLPAAIAGGVVGMTVGQALVIGGVSAAVGALTGSISASAGFFSGKKQNPLFLNRIDSRGNIAVEIDRVHTLLHRSSK